MNMLYRVHYRTRANDLCPIRPMFAGCYTWEWVELLEHLARFRAANLSTRAVLVTEA